MLHWDMFQVWYLPRPRWKRAPPWEGSKGSYRAERCTWIIFLTRDKWGGGDWVNFLATGDIAYYGAYHNDFEVNDTKTGIKWKNNLGNTWCTEELDERGSSSQVASWVSSATWKRATPEVHGVALARSLITNPNCLCFESMVHKFKWRKEDPGDNAIFKCPKMCFEKFYIWLNKFSFSGF